MEASQASPPPARPAGMSSSDGSPPWQAPAAASDADREQTVGVLREHWLAGRLTLEELEERVGEAYGARTIAELWDAVRGLPVPARRPPPRSSPLGGSPAAGRGVDSFVTGVAGLCLLLCSLGLLVLVSLPFSVCGWALGRQARRRVAAGGDVRHPGLATAGEVTGVIGTVLGAVLLAGCGVVVAGL